MWNRLLLVAGQKTFSMYLSQNLAFDVQLSKMRLPRFIWVFETGSKQLCNLKFSEMPPIWLYEKISFIIRLLLCSSFTRKFYVRVRSTWNRLYVNQNGENSFPN